MNGTIIPVFVKIFCYSVQIDPSIALGIQNLQLAAAANATINQLLSLGWPQLHLTSALLNGMVLNSTLATLAQNQMNQQPQTAEQSVNGPISHQTNECKVPDRVLEDVALPSSKPQASSKPQPLIFQRNTTIM